jgi:hypothetical protein
MRSNEQKPKNILIKTALVKAAAVNDERRATISLMRSRALADNLCVPVALEGFAGEGERPPPAASTGVRSEKVNVRLSAHEKARLEQLAKAKGFKGIADLLRASALDRSHKERDFAVASRRLEIRA